MVYLIISSCSKIKDDSVSVAPHAKVLTPFDYIDDAKLAERLLRIREEIFRKPEAMFGSRETYAFDLYVRAGKAYSKTYLQYYWQLKDVLIRCDYIYWFFLSGGYGIINALEKAKKYQASFNKNIAYQKGIPYTTPLWDPILPSICDSIFRKLNPEHVYVFGSRDYTRFIERTQRWREGGQIKIFKSFGQAGVNWINEKLYELVSSLLSGDIEDFNRKYPRRLISQGD